MIKIPPMLAHAAAAVIAAAFMPYAAQAQEPRERHEHEHDRIRHDHFFPAPGYAVTVLPAGNIALTFGGGRFFYHSGMWYQQRGPGFVVVRPPVGIVVPVLPPDYTMVSVAGTPYYYANDTYYAAGPGGYVVAQPPIAAGAGPGLVPQQPPPMLQAAPVPMPAPPMAPGYAVTALPTGNIAVTFGGGRFFYHAGLWYRKSGHSFIVVRPPRGIGVPILPPSYTTVMVAGTPYYYANDTYYVAGPGGYVVAQPPVAANLAPMQTQPAMPQMAPAPGAPGQASPGNWYYCDSARAYYPYVQECREGWRSVAAAPPQVR
jgi:hypothetical protein